MSYFFCRHILGEALGSLSLKELKNLEGRLEKGLSRVRSRKVYIMFLTKKIGRIRSTLWCINKITLAPYTNLFPHFIIKFHY